MNKKILKTPSQASGAAIVEAIFVIPWVLFLGMAILHLGLVYQAKSNLEYAGLMVARMAATSGFYLLPAVPNDPNDPNDDGRSLFPDFQTEVRCRMVASDPLDAGAICSSAAEIANVSLKVMRPYAGMFFQWSANACPGADCLIPNDNLFNYSDNLVGVASPSGNIEQLNIKDANILQLEVTYTYDSGVPFIGDIASMDLTVVSTVRMQTEARVFNMTEQGFFKGF